MSANRLPTRRCVGVTPSIFGAFGRVELSRRVITVRVTSLAMPSACLGSLLLDREEFVVSSDMIATVLARKNASCRHCIDRQSLSCHVA